VPIIKAKLDYSDDPLNLFEKISKIFVTINSKGTRIKMFDLIVALIGSRIRRRGLGSFRDMFQNIQEELEKNNFSIGEPVIMRLYLAVATNKTKFKDATKELDKKNEEELLNALNETKKALENSLEFLRKEMWILSSDYL
jgi:Skp family chaperone for outer membrane proteins